MFIPLDETRSSLVCSPQLGKDIDDFGFCPGLPDKIFVNVCISKVYATFEANRKVVSGPGWFVIGIKA